MRTAYLYIRVSTDEQAAKGYSMRSQEERLVKFCETNNILILLTIREDYSAKTFNRPEWNNVLKILNRKQTERPNLILFTRWDRFSRNAGDAYYMIALLKRMEIEVQAIEQMIDLSIPENKLVLALYLAVSEVENDRRALNIKRALYKARKEGRWIGPAPKGYKNKTAEDGKKLIAPREPEATMIRNIFIHIAQGDISIREAHRAAVQSGFKCSLNNFWNLIQNPVYCGKIKVPDFEDEIGFIAAGNHQGLISEQLFEQVQEVLYNRARKRVAKTSNNFRFPFRGILICPECQRILTGSQSKGKKQYYAYYHCRDGCRFRMRTNIIDQQFDLFLQSLIVPEIIIHLFQIVLKSSTDSKWKDYSKQQERITQNIKYLFNRIVKAKELFLKGEIEFEDFEIIKADCEAKINLMGKDLEQTSLNIIATKNNLKKESLKLLDIAQLYQTESYDIKKKLIRILLKESIIPRNNTFKDAAADNIVLIFQLNNNQNDIVKEKADSKTVLKYDEESKLIYQEFLKTTLHQSIKVGSRFWEHLPQIIDYLKKIAEISTLR